MTILYIAIFGVLGVLSRYGVSLLFGETLYPLATLTINVIGSFLIGLVFAAGVERSLFPAALNYGLMTGFLGGFTTFSAYCLELSRLLQAGRLGVALAYALLSVVLGVLATFGGLLLGRSF